MPVVIQRTISPYWPIDVHIMCAEPSGIRLPLLTVANLVIAGRLTFLHFRVLYRRGIFSTRRQRIGDWCAAVSTLIPLRENSCATLESKAADAKSDFRARNAGATPWLPSDASGDIPTTLATSRGHSSATSTAKRRVDCSRLAAVSSGSGGMTPLSVARYRR